MTLSITHMLCRNALRLVIYSRIIRATGVSGIYNDLLGSVGATEGANWIDSNG